MHILFNKPTYICWAHKNIILENQDSYFLTNTKGTTLTLPSQISLRSKYHKSNDLPMATSKNIAFTSMAFDAFTSQDVFTSRVEQQNQNLSSAQKVLLKWHWKLGHYGF